MIQLYGFGPTRSLRVLWALNELGVEYEFISVNLPAGENRTPEFLGVNPAGKLPVLVDGNTVLSESAAIVLYLAEKYPTRGLIPTGLGERAEMYRWLMFAMTELEQPLWRIARNTLVYPEERRVPADIPVASLDFGEMAAVLERHMAEREYIVGDRISVADCVTVYLVDWAEHDGLLAGFPNLQAYLQRMYARPTAPPRIAAAFAELGGEVEA